MGKKRLLVVYHSMIMGGSTTSLLGLLENLDTDQYEVDIQLFKNAGQMFGELPSYVRVLPEAQRYHGIIGRLIKGLKYVFSGYYLRAAQKKKRTGTANAVVMEFQAKHLSRGNHRHYDYAISFLEGWSSQYLAYQVRADKKYAWNHSTFSKTKDACESNLTWLERVDNIVFVADDCRKDFCDSMPQYAHKAVTIKNIIDSKLLRARAEEKDLQDVMLQNFQTAKCFKIITVCRVEISTKGLDRLILCAKELRKLGREFLWYVVGGGIELQNLQEMIAKAGLNDCVKAIGARMNPLPFVKAADVFCMLSRYEGKPMVITESMILGTPPLVTRYLSAREQIRDGVEGIIVDNDDDAAVPALVKCIDDPQFLAQMREYLLSHEYGNVEYVRYIEEKYLSAGI